MATEMTREEAKVAAEKLFEQKGGQVVVRDSCWNCNPAHENLKAENDKFILQCGGCGKWYYAGHNITGTGDPPPEDKKS